jgi:hypothetical protein
MGTTSFQWTRPVPTAWSEDLAQLTPGENVSSLHLSWLAGFPWEPVARWTIYEVLPAATVGKIIEDEQKLGIRSSLVQSLWQALEGPDPRVLGHWRKDHRVPGGRRWVSNSMVSRNQYDLHKQTGGLPLLCWIIEGSHGGHSWQFGPFERSFLLDAGIDPETIQALAEAWPDPGTLPYADYDYRVRDMLAERDLLRQWKYGRHWTDRTKRTDAGLILQTESEARRKQMQLRMMKWLDTQIADAVSDIPRRLLPPRSAFQPVERAADEDEAIANLLED